MNTDSNAVIITGIVCLCIIQIVAMLQGINGTLRMIIMGAICGLAGWRIPLPKKQVFE